MTIAVTAATGQLGRLAVTHLLSRGVPAADLVAVVRDPGKAEVLADLGVEVRRGDYTDPEGLRIALKGVEKVLLISSNDLGGHRAEHHGNVIDAAKQAGVALVVYTSAPHADDTVLGLAAEHRDTELRLAASGLPSVVLRNGWYLDMYTDNLAPALASGSLYGAAQDGRINGATRSDLAEAAAVVLTQDGHAGRVYELGGDVSFSMPELAAEVTRLTGTPVAYVDLPPADYADALRGAGLPTEVAELMADSDAAIAQGALVIETGDLARLLGRPATTLTAALTEALAAASDRPG